MLDHSLSWIWWGLSTCLCFLGSRDRCCEHVGVRTLLIKRTLMLANTAVRSLGFAGEMSSFPD